MKNWKKTYYGIGVLVIIIRAIKAFKFKELKETMDFYGYESKVAVTLGFIIGHLLVVFMWPITIAGMIVDLISRKEGE